LAKIKKIDSMKKTITITLFILIPLLSFSQNKFGVFAGVNGSTLSDRVLKSTYLGSNSFSFHIGGLYEYELNDKISFRPKFIFSKQGDREDFDNNINYELTYLNLPLNFKFFKKTYILVGPQIGFLLKTNKNKFDYGDIDTLDYGVNFGVGRNINDFFLELNLYQGLKTLIDVELQYTDISATNTLIQFSLGYNF